MGLQMVRETTAVAVGVASEILGEDSLMLGTGQLSKGMALELGAVIAGLGLGAFDPVQTHALHAGAGLLDGGIALLGRRVGLGLYALQGF